MPLPEREQAETSIAVGDASDAGLVRQVNEDSHCCLVRDEAAEGIDAVLAVADGIGGYRAGEVASQHATGFVCRRFARSAKDGREGTRAPSDGNWGQVLSEVIEQANRELYDLAVSEERFYGMGTTIVVAAIAGSRLFVSHVGDSRAYLVRNGTVHRLTEDHSWVAEQVRAGLLDPAAADSHPKKNIITRALGLTPVVLVDGAVFDVTEQDTVVLCTDGLTSLVSDDEVLSSVTTSDSPQQACEALVNLANAKGGFDNITVVIARLDGLGNP